jgi:hypothetical protein
LTLLVSALQSFQSVQSHEDVFRLQIVFPSVCELLFERPDQQGAAGPSSASGPELVDLRGSNADPSKLEKLRKFALNEKIKVHYRGAIASQGILSRLLSFQRWHNAELFSGRKAGGANPLLSRCHIFHDSWSRKFP